jgi:ABC-2 type transport system permease protein
VAATEAVPEVQVRTSEPPKLKVRQRLRELAEHREILVNLIRKELKVRYATSALGVIWSMLNPLLYLAVFGVVFTFFLRSGIPDFPVFLLSGIVAWTLFSTAIGQATTSIVGNANLVSKVAFPREILPLASIGAALVNFGFQLGVLLAFTLVIGHGIGTGVVLLPLAFVVLMLFTTAVGFLVAAFNVRYRDTQHLVELGLLAWFWLTPIVYPAGAIAEKFAQNGWSFDLFLINPLTDIAIGFQRALYGASAVGTEGGRFASEGAAILPDPGVAYYALRLGVVGAASLVLLYLSWRFFFNRSGDFAEEL